MKRGKIVGFCLLAIIAAVVLFFYAGSTVPAGQAPLTRLNGSNFGELRNAFNKAKPSVRVFALLSPT
jgi:hypothetical protein